MFFFSIKFLFLFESQRFFNNVKTQQSRLIIFQGEDDEYLMYPWSDKACESYMPFWFNKWRVTWNFGSNPFNLKLLIFYLVVGYNLKTAVAVAEGGLLCKTSCILLVSKLFNFNKVQIKGKLFQRCTHFLYCSVLSFSGKVNTRRTSKPDMESIFTKIIYEIFWS